MITNSRKKTKVSTVAKVQKGRKRSQVTLTHHQTHPHRVLSLAESWRSPGCQSIGDPKEACSTDQRRRQMDVFSSISSWRWHLTTSGTSTCRDGWDGRLPDVLPLELGHSDILVPGHVLSCMPSCRPYSELFQQLVGCEVYSGTGSNHPDDHEVRRQT